ncbi:unnamed protein product [Paramecium primaurelia]|uniref:Uncharacterized protein n=1 Tax=Paramecium primaurelia TaxID=5886 RepID=A0A8S1LQL7_PARPR|nr:unnamed protein product [Paramecium primaurelia]CAD8070067.1 unnamed protein product [Paramecium primaurelia]
MNRHILLLLFLFVALDNCVKFPIKQRCQCSEYDTLFCPGPPFCSINGSNCEEFQCKYTNELYCTPFDTLNRCKWNQSTNSCENYTYQCTELTTYQSCLGQFIGVYQEIECMWQDNQCKPQDCTQINNCDSLSCSMSTQGCGKKIENLDCSSYTPETCYITDGYGNSCHIDKDLKCKKYSALPICSELEEQMPDKQSAISFCNGFCYYDINSQQCIPKECSQITQESECTNYIYDIPNELFIPCIWSNSKCNEVSEKDFETFDLHKCFQFGMTHYTWQPSTSKCKQCSLVDRFKQNPSENPNSDSKDQNNGISILQWALMWIATQI